MLRKWLAIIPWWGWLIVGLVVLIGINYISGYIYNKSLFNLIVDEIQKDKVKTINNLKQELEIREREIQELTKTIESLHKQQTQIRQEVNKLRREINEKDKQIEQIRKEKELIVIPADPNQLLDEFRKRGYRPRVVLPN